MPRLMHVVVGLHQIQLSLVNRGKAMISYIHIPLIIVSFCVLLAIWRFWYCINHLGFTREVGRRAPQLAQGDILAVTFAAQPFVLAIFDWFQIMLPNWSAPIPSGLTAFMSIACLGCCAYVLRNSTERIAGHWVGTREGALRTVAALRIIDAAELAFVLDAHRKETKIEV